MNKFIPLNAASLEAHQRRIKNEEAAARFKAKWKEDNEDYCQGKSIYIRDQFWQIASDHVWWFISHDNIRRLKFSELNAEELQELLKAKQREALNSGIGGAFRRLGRKIDNIGRI